MKLRSVFFWLHLTAGSVAGLVILLMCVTGVLLAFERQIIHVAESGYRVAPPASVARELPIDELVAAAQLPAASALTSVVWSAEPGSPVVLGVGRGKSVFVNPYTGEVLGKGATFLRAFFQNVEAWHRWLGATGGFRSAGRAVTGVCNAAFLVLAASGIYLWWPRNWSWRRVKSVLFFKSRLSGRARDFNWHNVIGFWSSIPILVIVLCSVVMSYPWANNLVYRVTGNQPPGAAPARPPDGSANAERASLDLSGIATPLEAAKAKMEGWRTITLRMQPGEGAPLVFTIDRGNGGQPQKRSQLTLERATGSELKWEPFESNNAGRRLRAWIRFAHTGEAAGIAGQVIAAAASLGGCFLVWTGLAMALRRLRAWRERRRASEAFTPQAQTE